MRLLLLKYSNLGENKSPHRRFVEVIYLELGNENALIFHKGGTRSNIFFEKMKDLIWGLKKLTALPFWKGGMLPWGRSWSRIWQIWGKSLIDDTDMGSTGERSNHQFWLTLEVKCQNIKIYLLLSSKNSFTSPHFEKARAPPYRCFLWKQRLGWSYAPSHFTSTSSSKPLTHLGRIGPLDLNIISRPHSDYPDP